MKKLFLLAICMLMVGSFSSCQKDKLTDESIQKNIVGKWKKVSEGGQAELTNYKLVYTFDKDGNAVVSAAPTSNIWFSHTPMAYSIQDKTVTVSSSSPNYKTEWQLSAISAMDMSVKQRISFLDGQMIGSSNDVVYKKIANDFSSAIVGTWEGVSIEGEVSYGYIDHRWEFRGDGTYTYYNYENNQWVPSTNTMNEYFVDGDFLVFRWKDASNNEFREMWDIQNCDATQMVWTALRARIDNSTYTTSFTMKKVN